METLFSKVTEYISAFCNFAEIFNTCIGMFQKVAFLEISKSPLLTVVAGLPSTVYNATKNELLTKFVKGALKLIENFQGMISKGVPFWYVSIQTCKLQPSAVLTPEIMSPVESFQQKQVLTCSLQNSLST